jgi:DNA polymerase-1
VRSRLDSHGGEIVLCLHDELLVHVPRQAAGDVVQVVESSLAETAAWWAAGSGVRFVADITVGETWADAH